MSKLINDSKYEQDKDSLRTEFLEKYSKSKGWDIKNLTNEQIKEVKEQKGWTNPGMILG